MYWSFWQFPNFLRMQKFNLCNLIFRNLAVWKQSKITHCMVYLVKSSRYIVHSLYILYPLNSKKIYMYNNCSRYRVLIYQVKDWPLTLTLHELTTLTNGRKGWQIICLFSIFCQNDREGCDHSKYMHIRNIYRYYR